MSWADGTHLGIKGEKRPWGFLWYAESSVVCHGRGRENKFAVDKVVKLFGSPSGSSEEWEQMVSERVNGSPIPGWPNWDSPNVDDLQLPSGLTIGLVGRANGNCTSWTNAEPQVGHSWPILTWLHNLNFISIYLYAAFLRQTATPNTAYTPTIKLNSAQNSINRLTLHIKSLPKQKKSSLISKMNFEVKGQQRKRLSPTERQPIHRPRKWSLCWILKALQKYVVRDKSIMYWGARPIGLYRLKATPSIEHRKRWAANSNTSTRESNEQHLSVDIRLHFEPSAIAVTSWG